MCFLCLLIEAGVAQANDVQKVNNLIDEGLFTNEAAIKQAAMSLTEEQKNAVYSENEKPWWPFALNLGVGYGVGSYVQGDTGFAVASTVIDAACDVAVVVCYAGFCSTIYDRLGTDGFKDDYRFTDSDIRAAAPWIAGMVSAVGVASVWRVIETIRPFNYAKKYNSNLKQCLYADDMSFMIVPSMTAENNMQVALGCKVNY